MKPRNRASAAAAATGMGSALGNIGHSNSKANVAITARIINVDTGEILGVADGKGQSSRASTDLLGGGGNWHGFGGGACRLRLQRLPADHHRRSHQAGRRQALHRTWSRTAPKVAARTITVEGMVAAVEGNQIVLNVGGKAGIKVGDQFNVERVTKEIKDPTTGSGDCAACRRPSAWSRPPMWMMSPRSANRFPARASRSETRSRP